MFVLMAKNIFLIICSNMLLIWAKHNIHTYAPQLKAGGQICFCCRSCQRQRSLVSVCYLLNQWFDLIKRALINCWEGCKELIRFGDRYLISTLKFQILSFRTLSLDLEFWSYLILLMFICGIMKS